MQDDSEYFGNELNDGLTRDESAFIEEITCGIESVKQEQVEDIHSPSPALIDIEKEDTFAEDDLGSNQEILIDAIKCELVSIPKRIPNFKN